MERRPRLQTFAAVDLIPANITDRLSHPSESVAATSNGNSSVAASTRVPISLHTRREQRREYPTGWNSPAFQESLRINNRIIRTESLEDLYHVVSEELDGMLACELGTVNMSSTMYRAAILWRDVKDSAKGLQQDGSRWVGAQCLEEARAQVGLSFLSQSCTGTFHSLL
jgi:hypothetical protein